MRPVLTILGKDISSYVSDFGSLEEIQDAGFTTGRIIMPELEVVLNNGTGAFTSRGSGSLFGHPWYNAEATIAKNGRVVFYGLATDLVPTFGAKEVRLKLTNILQTLADTQITASATSTNPAIAAYKALYDAGLSAYLDRNAFMRASSVYTGKGCAISLSYSSTDGVSALKLLTDISEACSLTVFERAGEITCKVFEEYPGNDSALRGEITKSLCREIGDMVNDDRAFANRVNIVYASSVNLVAEDYLSKRKYRAVKDVSYTFSTGGSVSVATESSARALATLALSRLKERRRKIAIGLGPEFVEAHVGDRHPITISEFGLARAPFEIIELRRSLTTDDVDAVFLSLD